MADVTLANYLGTGSNPNLTMVLSANGPKWDSYRLNYRGVPGKIPWSSDSANQWSSWNVVDEKQNYYGTINLNCDGTTAQFANYKGGEGYYLDGIKFAPVQNQERAYQIAAEKVIRPPIVSSPFPDARPATPALYPGTNRPIVLSAKGAQIVNDRGATVVLKGLSRPSLEWNAQGQHLSPSDIATMRGWGANVLRIPLNQVFWHDSHPRTTIGSYKQIVDAMIYYAIEQKMAVVLDLHRVTLEDRQTPMANQDSIAFWQDIAKTYASFGTVLLELYNEPFDITQEQWLSGGGGYVGYQQLYDAVRAAGANNPCIVGGLDWAYDLSFVSSDRCVKGTGIVYCSHPYNPKGKNDYTGPGGSLATDLAGVLGEFPVIFTEFGGNQDDEHGGTSKDLDYYTYVTSYANTNGLHYTGWAWWVDPKPWFPCLIGDWTGKPIWGGEIVHKDLQTHPGTGTG